MTNPATIRDSATNTFTAPSGATLEADTSYFVVMENSNTNNDPNALYQVGLTTSDGEDSTGLSDWDIDDTGRTGTPGWSATSGNVAFRIQVRGTVDVDPAATTLPELSFQSINISVDEDGSQAGLAVELSQTSADTVTVDYATSDITAEAGDDYTDTSGTLTFTAGETVMAIIVPILDDAIYEPTERFDVTLSNPTGATLPAFPGARVNIAEDESPPTASIANVTVSEGAGTMTLTLNLSHESSLATAYETTTSRVGGTATGGTDYENFLSGGGARITVPAGDTQANLDITITDDAAAESSETITIRWDNDATGGKGDATPSVINFTGAITDNDSAVSTDATLRALVVRDDAENRTLTPGFTPGTYAYAAQLVNAATTATLTATPNHAEAEVTNVTLAGTAIADTNLTDGITVPSLVVGDNVIVVTVTAQDNTAQDYTVTITRAPALPAVNIVPSSWSLKPAGLSAGEFRLIFLSSTKHNAESSNIGTYNTFVQNRAAAGHADIRDYSSAFKVVGCTADVDARDNTGTTHTSADRGVPIYWLNGTKVADNYQDFYNGTWDDEANDRNESGNDAHDTSQSSNYPYTGCDHNGTESISGNSLALGKNAVRTGEPNSSMGTQGPLQGAGSSTSDGTRPFYGLSSVFQVEASSDATLSALVINDGTNDLTLDPTFASATYVYETDVDNAITTATLTATPNHASAAVSAATLDGTAIADTTFTDGITVPSLVVGDNVIVVTVTAEDATTQAYTITVARGIPYTEVPANWSLIPAGLNNVGDEFRLIFVSDDRRGAGSSSIAIYNTWIQGQAANGHHNVKAYSSSFKVVGCTGDVDAKDNTHTTSDPGVPIYWLGGNKVADDYPDFYNTNWDDEENPLNQRGEVGRNTALEVKAWTGCAHNGVERMFSGTSYALGKNHTVVGWLNHPQSNRGPLTSTQVLSSSIDRPMYGLSDVFRVVAANSNNPPVFTGGSTQTRSFAEVEGDTAVASESNIGDPFSATDSDIDALAYTLGGTDAASFSFDASTGQIKQKNGEIYNYEAKSAYSVMVTVHDGTVSVTANVTINLTDVSEVPVQMDMPNVTPGSLSTSTLEVTWDIPPNDGRPPITHYSVQYQKSGDPSTLASIADIATGFDTAVITGLQLGTAYQVQILAANDDGDGAWSPFGEGTTLSSLGTTMIVQDASGREDSSFLHFEINFSETLTENIFFDYTTSIESGDTAEANDFDAETVTDYRVQSGGDIAFITIDPNDDDLYEGDETFTITFSNLVNVYGTGNNLTATGTIIDDETQPDLSIFDASATEGEAIEFTVLLIGDLTEEDVTFDYATSRKSDDNSETK